MDNNLAAAIVTSISTAASTAGVAITALILSNKRMDRLEVRLEKIEAALQMLTGALHELDKRVSIIEHRIFRRE